RHRPGAQAGAARGSRRHRRDAEAGCIDQRLRAEGAGGAALDLMEIELKLDPEAAEIEAVRAPLSAHAEQARPGGNYQSVGLLLRESGSGDVVGGLTGYALYDWL